MHSSPPFPQFPFSFMSHHWGMLLPSKLPPEPLRFLGLWLVKLLDVVTFLSFYSCCFYSCYASVHVPLYPPFSVSPTQMAAHIKPGSALWSLLSKSQLFCATVATCLLMEECWVSVIQKLIVKLFKSKRAWCGPAVHAKCYEIHFFLIS